MYKKIGAGASLRYYGFTRFHGFALKEVLMTLFIGAVVFGSTVGLLVQTLRLIGLNISYSVLQRSLLSSIEFLPRAISCAAKIEIIADDSHVISDELLSAGWNYIALKDGSVRHIYWNGKREEEKITGSALIENLKFTAGALAGDGAGSERALRVRVTARGSDGKTFALSRSLMIGTDDDISGINGVPLTNSFSDGALLRYRVPQDKKNSAGFSEFPENGIL